MLPPVDRTQAELASLWGSWPPDQQDYYEYWLDLGKPFEKAPLQAACFAARRVENLTACQSQLAETRLRLVG